MVEMIPDPRETKISDQMPEEAPAAQVHDDVPEAPEGAAREAARRHASEISRKARERDRAWEQGHERRSRGHAAGRGQRG